MKVAARMEDVKLPLQELTTRLSDPRAYRYVKYWASAEFVERANRLYRADAERYVEEVLPEVAQATRQAVAEGYCASAQRSFEEFRKSSAKQLPYLQRIADLDADPGQALDHDLFKKRYADKWPFWAIWRKDASGQ